MFCENATLISIFLKKFHKKDTTSYIENENEI